jgi:D-sedoheptulose 7-phosphate isomerase
MDKKIELLINESVDNYQRILKDKEFITKISEICNEMINTFKNNGKVLFCGNGGSAADAQHFSAELSGRFKLDRAPLFAEALHANTSYLTSVANDYSYDDIFSRAVIAKGRKGDILVGISTSGNSKNVIRALEEAKKIGMITIGFTGKSGGQMMDLCDYTLNIPSDNTPRIQEAHELIGHIICELVEKKLFGME